MRKVRNLALSAALFVLAAGVPFAGTAVAQPHPPMPPGMPAPSCRAICTSASSRGAASGAPARGPIASARDRTITWIRGYWHHSGEAWAWNDGRWAERRTVMRTPTGSTPGTRMVKGGTRYTPGHWSYEKVIYNH